MIVLKSRREIAKMREAGKLVAEAHAIARDMVRPGITTLEIDTAIEALFDKHDATPLFKGFPGEVPFPAVTCMSRNEEIVHGIPSHIELQPGDILSVDTGCRLNGWCGDSAWTYAVGEIDEESQRLMEIGEQCLAVAIQQLEQCSQWSEVARAIMATAHGAGFSLVEQFVGHGIGRDMHEPPQVPNFTSEDSGYEDFEIKPGLVLAIEPMVNAGGIDFRILDDKWTAVTKDGKRSVHFEHTVALTKNGAELLTKLDIT